MIETPLRPRLALEGGWEFVPKRARRSWLRGKGPEGEAIALPHCWNAGDTFQYGRTSYSGWGTYRRFLAIPDEPAVPDIGWRFCLGGFYGVGDVWWGGDRLARIDGQFLGAAVSLPPRRADEECVIAVRIDNRWYRDVLPGFRQPDFILHGGLAGGAWLEGLPIHHFDTNRIHVVSEQLREDTELVKIEWALAGEAASSEVAVDWRVTDALGRTVASTPTSRGHGVDEARSTALEIPNPRCWSPDDPALYWAEGRLLGDHGPIDIVRIRFGIRRAEFRPRQGLFVDGVRVDLHGCNRHEAIPGFGNALPDELQRRDARILKELGCNFVRLSHYPQSPVFLDACDELGIMVYAEIATWKSVRSTRGWRRAARRQMRDLIVRDRHHPSVVVWGMGNESRSRKAYLELRAIARELDPDRPVTYAENHLYRARRERTIGIPDVWSVNYELDVLDQACDSSRLRNVLLSECCNHPTSDRGEDREELLQVAIIEREWEHFADLPHVAGHAVWSFSDYATEHRKRFRRLTGLFDSWRRPKMAAALFRARFSAEPFVALFVTQPGPDAEPTRYRRDHRSDGEGRAPLELHALTNCETLRLARDGSMLAVFEGAIHHVLPLFGSFDEIIATGSQDGAVVQDRIRRYDDPRRIHLRSASDTVAPTFVVDVEIHDGSSRVIGDWNGSVQLSVEGPGRCHSFNGRGDVIVRRGTGTAFVTVASHHEEVVVTASAEGLAPAFLSLHDSTHDNRIEDSIAVADPGATKHD